MNYGTLISKVVEAIEPKLQRKYETRERLLLLSRELIRLSGETVSLSHRGKREEALKRFEESKRKVEEIMRELSSYPDLLYGDIATSLQEFSEAAVVMSFKFGEELPLPEHYKIPEPYFVLGIADSIGEMRREVLESIRRGDLKVAEEIFRIMTEIYEAIWKLEYPKSLVPSLRQKIDHLRRILEETDHDLFLAMLSRTSP
jgi:translin